MDGTLLRMTPPPGVRIVREKFCQFSLTSFPVVEDV